MRSNDVPTPLYVDHDNQRLGIGATSPSEKLEVDGIIKVVHTDDSYAKYRGQGVFFNRSNSYLSPEQDNFASLLIGYNGARWGNVEINGAFIKFENGPNEFMRITSAGNVGIGTDSPASKLHVAGEIRVDPGDAFVFDVSNNIYAVAAQNQFRLYSGGNPVINVPTSGNVGIGTTSPSAKLHLADSASGGNPSFILQDNARSGAAALNYISLTDSLNTNQARIGYLSGLNTELTLQNLVGDTSLVSSSQMKITAGTNTIFENSGSEKMRINSNGNVGIGTTSPGSKLEVNGEIDSEGYLINGMGWALENSGVLTLGDWDGQEFSTRIMDNNSSEVLRVTDGNVGIGTTNPAAKLDIESTTSGVLLPRMTTAQVNAISSPSNGLTVYNTTLNTLCFYNGSSWWKVSAQTM